MSLNKNSFFKLTAIVGLSLFHFVNKAHSQTIISGEAANQRLAGSNLIRYTHNNSYPDFVDFRHQPGILPEDALKWMEINFHIEFPNLLVKQKTEVDELGYNHVLYAHYYNGIRIENDMYKVHSKNGLVVCINGTYHEVEVSTIPAISAEQAVEFGKDYVNADTYMWEIPGEEQFLKRIKKNISATYYPQPELVIAPVGGKGPDYRLCWKFEVYAKQPVSKQKIFVDAHSGEIIFAENQLCHIDTPGSAVTSYSGTRPIIADSYSGHFRLRETSRGDGVETYDMNNGTDYNNAVDFEDDDNNWNNPIDSMDHYGYDAHWGAEMTYDYFYNFHSRNSYDNNGTVLLSFVHYDVNYANAFWNGMAMTYGDGSGSITPLTTVDITGHEITHGVTQFSAGLEYQDESGALNESFSDIFGVCIDNYARGVTGIPLWRMGEECFPPNGIRLMSNPNSMGDPDTYQGTNWYTGTGDNGGVHTNSGVQNFWFYLMCEGGTGTNDNADAYNVAGIGIANASRIAYRNLNVYLTPTSNYSDARFYAIISAQDLFGECSPEVETTMNAWYAVGVGAPYYDGVQADFTSSAITLCTEPTTVYFQNNSATGNPETAYLWDFGDGSTSTSINPSHSYLNNGSYTVTLIADANGCGKDTIISVNHIEIAVPPAPMVSNYCTLDNPVIADLTADGTGDMVWFSSPSSITPLHVGPTYTTPSISSPTTYYVETQIPNGIQHVGPVDNTFGSGNNFNSPYLEYLEFTVYQPITLESFKTYSGIAGNRTIELYTGTGTLITTAVRDIPHGESIVNLGWELQPGNYRIGGTYMNLYKNGSGCNYPYNLASLVSITSSSDGPLRYFYFYDWEISSSCISERVPVVVNPYAPVADFTWTENNQVATFTNTSMNGNSYFWDFGGGNTSTATNPVHDFNWGGNHTVMLVAINNGCYDTLWVDLSIIGIDENDSFHGNVYPNPFTNHLNIWLDLKENNQLLQIDVMNMLGEVVSNIYSGIPVSGNFNTVWTATENLSSGAYLLQIRYGNDKVVQRIVKAQ